MTNKCKNCGFKYGEDDIFCARCGYRLENGKEIAIKSAMDEFDKDLPNSKTVAYDFEKPKFTPQKPATPLDNPVVAVCIFLFVLTCALSGLMYYLLNGHHSQKQTLQYKNLSNNPAQIPLLKEPLSYSALASNLKEIEDFLLVYLQQSSDPRDKKEQVFASYLTEMEKMPNVLSDIYEPKGLPECANTQNVQTCVNVLNNKFDPVSIQVYTRGNTIYLYPDYKSIFAKYSQYVSSEYKDYLELKAKYSIPVSLGLFLNIKPKTLANKIYDFEQLYLNIDNQFIKEEIEKILYHDFRKLIFTPSIYATQTQEMKKEFKNAYQYFINSKKDSAFRPILMSYMDKKRAYSEENFNSDYPYKIFEDLNFDESFEKYTLKDIFPHLRKNLFVSNNDDKKFTYVFNSNTRKWTRYSPQVQLVQGEFVISEPDENNNVSIYNYMYSPMQELNILKYSQLFMVNDNLYVYNSDKLSISKVNFNSKTFNLYHLNHIDVTTLFPGIEVINIDTFPSYNIQIEKANSSASYIILSRYSQGWAGYSVVPMRGKVSSMLLPNMFYIDSEPDVVVSFGAINDTQFGFSESKPTYKFTIKTAGYVDPNEEQRKYSQYDEKTYSEQAIDTKEHQPNIMPKLEESSETIELIDENLLAPPKHTIEPPFEFE